MKISIRARSWRTIIILCLTIACLRSIAPARATLNPAQFLITQKGNLPIVISAPHGGRNPIPGIPERQAVKGRKYVTVRDENTAELAQKLATVLEQKLGNKVFPANNSPQQPEDARFNGGYIVQNYGGKEGTGIDAIQLELGAQLRDKARLDLTAGDLAEAIEVFAREYLPQSKL